MVVTLKLCQLGMHLLLDNDRKSYMDFILVTSNLTLTYIFLLNGSNLKTKQIKHAGTLGQ